MKRLADSRPRLIPLAGLSGIWMGITLLLSQATELVHALLFNPGPLWGSGQSRDIAIIELHLVFLFLIGVWLLPALAITFQTARKRKLKKRGKTARSFMLRLGVPSFIGLITAMIVAEPGGYESGPLILGYGLGLILLGRKTVGEVFQLGLFTTLVTAAYLTSMNIGGGGVPALSGVLIFAIWLVAVPLAHVIYPAVMYFRYERKRVNGPISRKKTAS